MNDPVIHLIWLSALAAILVVFWLVYRLFILPARRDGPRPGHVWVPGEFDRKGILFAYAVRKHAGELLDQRFARRAAAGELRRSL